MGAFADPDRRHDGQIQILIKQGHNRALAPPPRVRGRTSVVRLEPLKRGYSMKKLTPIAVVLTLGCSAALAQPNENRFHKDRGVAGQQQIEIQYRNSGAARNEELGDRNNARDENRNDDRTQRSNDVRDNPHWSRGDRLPKQYRDNQYVVSDWKTRHLRTPPRGYHWVRTDDRYVLSAIATGVIADIIINSQR
jgi:Ni/Co efflux regulator RcnB